jgi:Zn-dependent peptidase ImmA (M78 family)
MATWHPWRDVRERAQIEVVLCDLPVGVRAVYARRGPDEAILLDRQLSPVERRAALAHELVHAERGGSGHVVDAPAQWAPVVRREEARVDDIVAERLIPLGALAELVERRVDIEPVTADVVASEFGVPVDAAERALRLLARRRVSIS